MKALLRLQFYMSGGRGFIVTLAVYPMILLVFPHHTPDASLCVLTAAMLPAGLAFVPLGTERAESVSHWRSYAKTLPYSREQLVDAKYLFSLLCAAAAALLGALMLPLMMIRYPEAVSALPYAPSAAEITLMNTALSSAIVLASAAFLHPSYFQRSGKLISYILGFLIFFFVFMFFVPFRLMMALSRCRWEPMTPFTRCLPYLMFAVSAVCFVLSWRISRKLYCRRRKRRRAA